MDPYETFFRRFRPGRFAASADPNWVQQQDYPGGDQISTYGFIEDGAVEIGSFASGIIPPRVVAALPTLPDSEYAQGSLVFLTTDAKLYRNTDGSTWSKATDGADLVANSVTAGQIAAAAIGADEIAANAVTADKLMVGNVGNAVTNPSFETGDFTGWTTSAASGGSVSVITTNPVHGKYNALITNGAGTANGYIQTAAYIPVGPSQVVSVGLWSVLANPSTFIVRMKAFDASLSALADTDSSAFAPGSAAWVHNAFTLTTPASTAFVQFQIISQSLSSTLWIDDFTVITGGAVIDSYGITVTNGRISVMNGSSVVVIDGSSNMFKIYATGTLSRAFPNGTYTTATTSSTLTGLGSGYSVPPACIFMVYGDWGGDRWSGMVPAWDGTGHWAVLAWAYVDLTGGQVRVNLGAGCAAVNYNTYTAYTRYYVLAEAGI